MSQAKFEHYDLTLVEPTFDSSLVNFIIDLNHLRKKRLIGSTNFMIFFQLKNIFHMLESIGSARIEGNNTTIAEYIETKIEKHKIEPAGVKEIQNIENAMAYIEENVKSYPINKLFVSEIHQMLVKGLVASVDGGEGDHTPGQYRKGNVTIAKSSHIPPEWFAVDSYMNELFDFINREDNPKYDLLKVAIAHHRFVWIHPFNNGNGRTVRLFTYAMLLKLGFNVDQGRILNPTAVFCNNRDNYYKFLSRADAGTKEGILEWCEYVLKGLNEEIEKIDKLLDYDFLKREILFPAINYSLEREHITETESKILKIAAEEQVIQSSNLKSIFPKAVSSEISRQIKKLIEKNMLVPPKEKARKYVIYFSNNYLLRGIIMALSEKGFLPVKE